MPVRVIADAARRFHASRGTYMASSLSFQTIVSIVPVLLFTVGILRRLIPGDPARDIEEFMSAYLVPEMSSRVTDLLLDIVERFNFAALGWIGAVGTFLATYMLVLGLKSCLNDLGLRSSRSGFFRRLGWVTIVVLLLPPLVWLAATEVRVFVRLPSFMSVLKPYLSLVGVLFLVYRFLPDRGPSSRSSLLAAALVGVLLEIEKMGLAAYIRQVEGVYELIYGTLVFLPLFLAWLYLSWCLLLLGATLAVSIDAVTGLRKPTEVPPRP